MITTLTQFGDWVFANDGFVASLALNESRGQYAANPTITARAGSAPVVSQGTLSARVIPVEFDYDPALDPHGDRGMQQMIDILAGMLDPRDLTPRRLIGTRHDGTIVRRMATVSSPDTWSDDESLNFVRVVFTSDAPEWEAVTPTTVGPIALYADGGAAIPVPNVGLATVEPTITITPGAFSHSATSADVGWQYRRTLSVINNTGKTWTNRPLQLDLGDTSAWVTAGKALANGNDLRILLDGEDLPRSLVGWNRKKTFAWITPLIAAGETITLEVIYGNPSAGAPTTLDGTLHPAFVIESDSGSATSGTTTALNDTSKNWSSPFQDWRGATLYMLSGANAGLSRAVISSSATQIVTAAFPSAIAAGDAYLVALSSNSRWSWALDTLAFPNASTPTRGRWYLNSATKRPRDIDFTVPGAWAPYAMADNSDRFANTSYSWISSLPFALLDAYRTWEGGGARGRLTSEDGVADGVWFSSALPILAYTFDANLSANLNGMAQAVVMARTSGAEAWEPIDSVTANGPMTKTVTLPIDDDYYHLYHGLTPSDTEGVIRVDRARDRGTTSDDGNTRNSTVAGPITLRKTPSASGAAVTDSGGATVSVPNATVIERDGRFSGGWRGVIYTTTGGDEYKGWLPSSALSNETGGTTLVDGSKNWATNMLVGAAVTITGCPNKALVGKVGTVTANTATTLTVTVNPDGRFRATVPSGTAYETRQPKTTVRLTDGAYCYVDFDASGIVLTAIGAETPVYQMAAALRTGRALFGASATLEVGLARKLFLASGDALVLDGLTRQAKIVTTGNPEPRILTDPAVSAWWYGVDDAGVGQEGVRGARWLPLVIGINQLANGGAEDGVLTPWVASSRAGVTGAVTVDSSKAFAGSKSFKFAITANTNPSLTADLLTLEYPKFDVAPGQVIAFAGAFWGGSANLIPQLGIRWYDAGGALLGTAWQSLAGVTANAWWTPSSIEGCVYDPNGPYVLGGSSLLSPANTAKAALICTLYGKTANVTGTAWFDALDYGSPLIAYAETGANQVNVAASYHPGWLS